MTSLGTEKHVRDTFHVAFAFEAEPLRACKDTGGPRADDAH